MLGFFYFINKKRGTFDKKDSALLYISLGYIVCYLVSTLLNFRNANFFDAVQDTIETIGFLCIASAGILFHTKTFFKGFLISGVFWTFLHLCTILIYQDGGMRKGQSVNPLKDYSENWYLLTHANASYFIILAVVAVLFFYAYAYQKKLKLFAWAYLLFAIYCFFTQWSVSGLIGFIIFAFFIFIETVSYRFTIDHTRLNKRKSNFKIYLMLCFILDVLLTFGGLLKATLDLFNKYFNKLHSLKARIIIWEKCLALLKTNFVIGFGWETEIATIAKTTYNHMHNVLLEILYRGGIISCILFGLGLYFAFFYKHPERYQRTQGYRILIYITIAFFVSSNFDFYLYRYEILVVLVMFLYYENIQIDLKKRKLLRS